MNEKPKPECPASPLKSESHEWQRRAVFAGAAVPPATVAEIIIDSCKHCGWWRAWINLKPSCYTQQQRVVPDGIISGLFGRPEGGAR